MDNDLPKDLLIVNHIASRLLRKDVRDRDVTVQWVSLLTNKDITICKVRERLDLEALKNSNAPEQHVMGTPAHIALLLTDPTVTEEEPQIICEECRDTDRYRELVSLCVLAVI